VSAQFKEKIQQRWTSLDERFAALNIRERILITASIFLVLYLIWDFMLASPMQKQREILSGRYQAINRELGVLSAQEQVMVKALSQDPNAAKRREIVRLERQLKTANEKLQAMSVGLIPAQQLPMVLQDMLKESSHLKLVGLQSLDPIKLQLAKGSEDDADTADEENTQTVAQETDEGLAIDNDRLAEERIVGVYKYAVRVSVKGSYFDVVEYLQKLEQLPWRFYWNFVEYEVDHYPEAFVTLEVYTLSVDKGGFDV